VIKPLESKIKYRVRVYHYSTEHLVLEEFPVYMGGFWTSLARLQIQMAREE